MTRRGACPEPETLSRLLDGELDPGSLREVERHLPGCAACEAEVASLAEARELARRAVRARGRAAILATPGDGCLSHGLLAELAHGALATAAAERAEAHLASCDACLRAAAEAIAIVRTLASAAPATVPEALRRRVASRWAPTADERAPAGVVVRLVRGVLELLESRLGGGVTAIEPLAAAAAPLRGAAGAAVSFVIRAPGAEIRATLVPDGDSVGLTLALRDAEGRALAGQRIALRRQRRAIFSARTDDAGELAMPQLEPAVYEVSCPGIATDFRLDLRS
jgi:anti-sigma factor RsiW